MSKSRRQTSTFFPIKRVEKRERSVKKREKIAIGWFFSFVHSCQLSFRLGIYHHIPGFIQGKYLVHAFSHEMKERRRRRRKARRKKKEDSKLFHVGRSKRSRGIKTDR